MSNIEKDKLLLKEALMNYSKEFLKKRVETAEIAMNEAQNASTEEERSTAGDKYDTSRAMSHNLRDMNAKQLSEALKAYAAIDQIEINKIYQQVNPGAIVKTSNGVYFIAASIGIVKHTNEDYFIISLNAPIGQAMNGKKAGEIFQFNGKEFKIMEIY